MAPPPRLALSPQDDLAAEGKRDGSPPALPPPDIPVPQKVETQVEREYVTAAEAAEYLHVSVETLSTWRSHGGGPEFSKFGESRRGRGRVVYAIEDLRNFVAYRRRASTSVPAPRWPAARVGCYHCDADKDLETQVLRWRDAVAAEA